MDIFFFNVNMNVYKIIRIIIGTGYAKMPCLREKHMITATDFKPNKGI